MVTRRLLIVCALLAAAVFGSAVPAFAIGGTSGSDGSTSSQNQTQGNDGGPVHATARSCSIYATSESFGLYCPTGGGGQTYPLSHYVGDNPPRCWDGYVAPADVERNYGIAVPVDATYNTFVHSCFLEGLDVKQPLVSQHPPLSQQLIEIDKRYNKPCPDNNGKDPVVAPTPDQFLGINMTCFLQAKPPQTYVTKFEGQYNSIPDTIMHVSPNGELHTQVKATFTDAADCPDCSQDNQRTPNKDLGGVTMWAEMTGFKILPYGPYDADSNPYDGRDAKDCDGTADPKAANACTFTYTYSSGGQPSQYFPFRGVATWQVKYDSHDGAGVHTLATFHKPGDLPLRVSDVQALVVPEGN